jgi:predicted nucleic acid-binding Zn ribbon protein
MLESMCSTTMERAGKTISRLRGMSGLPAEDLARSAWPSAVGPRIAAHAAAVALVRTKLVVEVADSVWQKQLWQLRGPILAKLGELLGAEMVTELEFRIGVPRRPPARSQEPFPGAASEADGIGDPLLRRIYIESRKKAIS